MMKGTSSYQRKKEILNFDNNVEIFSTSQESFIQTEFIEKSSADREVPFELTESEVIIYFS